MPMPGSQQSDTLEAAYFLHSSRWFFRLAFAGIAMAGLIPAFKGRQKWWPLSTLLIAAMLIWIFNFQMAADIIFKQPEKLTMLSRSENLLPDSALVLGIGDAGEARAYPLRFLTYHHQVQDTLAGKPVIVTYCSVCRSGRVFEPLVKGNPETFRLVGMDQFNAMFEDKTTKSWWQQATGEAVAGPLKGAVLPEIPASQMTLGQWLELFPNSLVMQADQYAQAEYDSLGKYERGTGASDLTQTDSLSWQKKSWVVGIHTEHGSKAYDWNRLKKERLIQDKVGNTRLVLALASDNHSFAAFEVPENAADFLVRHDTLFSGDLKFDFYGRNTQDPAMKLKRIPAYQEFWHSWQTFNPGTSTY